MIVKQKKNNSATHVLNHSTTVLPALWSAIEELCCLYIFKALSFKPRMALMSCPDLVVGSASAAGLTGRVESARLPGLCSNPAGCQDNLGPSVWCTVSSAASLRSSLRQYREWVSQRIQLWAVFFIEHSLADNQISLPTPGLWTVWTLSMHNLDDRHPTRSAV